MFQVRRTVVFSALLALVVVSAGFPAQAQMKIAYIRSEYIFNNYEPYIEAQKQLEEYQKKEFDTLQKMKDELDKKFKEAQDKALLMTPEMKQTKMEELTKQGEELDRRYEALMNPETGLIVKKQAELLQPIIDRINEVLMRIAKNEQYDFIFDATPGPQGNTILFANEKYDISDQILNELKKESSGQ